MRDDSAMGRWVRVKVVLYEPTRVFYVSEKSVTKSIFQKGEKISYDDDTDDYSASKSEPRILDDLTKFMR
jgi:hypothetical protein